MQNNDLTPASQEASIKNVTIHTGLTDKQLNPGQYSPYDLKTADGHYLIKIADDFQNIAEKLIYDGTDITLDGKINSIGLSHNGLHYIYSIEGKTSDDLYIDGKKVATDVRIYDPRITDDGQHYFYISQPSRNINEIGTILKKNGQPINAYNNWIYSYQISSDGQHYLVQSRNTNSTDEHFDGSMIVLDGKEISLHKTLRDGELALSDNGEHYGYVLEGSSSQPGNEELYIDGKKELESRTLYSLHVTDSGDYAVSAPEDKVFYTSKGNIPMKSNPSEAGAMPIFVNEDLSHHLVSDTKWYMDDKEIKPDGSFFELEGSSVFVYSVTK
jgi:hypothetical protein